MIPGSDPSPDVVINAVEYGVKAPWPAALPGASLQLIDAEQDNSRVANWGSSNATGSSDALLQWQYVTADGTASSSRLYIYMASSGEVYLDDLKLVEGNTADAGVNLLPDGDFESGFPGPWNVSPNLAASALNSATRHSGQSSLHLVSANAGSSQSTAIWQDIGPLATDAPYTLSYWYLPKHQRQRLDDSAVGQRHQQRPKCCAGPNTCPAVYAGQPEFESREGAGHSAGVDQRA